jgi:hypothetical protein
MWRPALSAILSAAAVWAAGPASPAPPAARVECSKPRTLRLVRYEDRSARLYCAGRVLVRISVPY